MVCKHCPDLNISANSDVGGWVGEGSYSDLVLVLEGTSRLRFKCRGFRVTSRPFTVINTDPSYPFMLDEIPELNSADHAFSQQPKLTVKDDYGNFVRVDSIAYRTVSVKLVGGTPIAPVLTPGPPAQVVQHALAPGQLAGSVCRAAARLFEGTHMVIIDGDGVGSFTDLVLRQVH